MTAIDSSNFSDDPRSAAPAPRVIDVSHLPASAIDHRSPIWWGNALLLCIETSMFAIAIVCYFYYQRNFEVWPPPKVDVFPVLYDTRPLLFIPTVNLGVLLLSVIFMVISDRACIRMNEPLVKFGGTVALLLAIASIVLRFKEFWCLHFTWDENAYASITWTLLGLHLLHLVVLSVEDGLMMIWCFVKGLDDKHARDIRVTAVYWYWVVAMYVILYGVIYWSPRLL